MNKQQAGFTLIELVMVIIILGILAATAVPRFVDLSGNARTASVQSLMGALRSAATIAKATQLSAGALSNASVILEGVTVNMSGNYPTPTNLGIDAALSDLSGFTPSGAGPRTFTLRANCTAVYANTGTGAATITSDLSAC